MKFCNKHVPKSEQQPEDLLQLARLILWICLPSTHRGGFMIASNIVNHSSASPSMNDNFAPSSPEMNMTFGEYILRKWQGVIVSA